MFCDKKIFGYVYIYEFNYNDVICDEIFFDLCYI